jgi:hypothetical protein
MKAKTNRKPPTRPRRDRAGAVAYDSKPAPGWKARTETRRRTWVNPRPPSVPSTMDLRLDEYFAGAALIGVLASQAEEPDHKWACDWSFRMGRAMAAVAVKLRKKR